MIHTEQANKAIDLLLIEFGLERTDLAVQRIKGTLKQIEEWQFNTNETYMREKWECEFKEKWEIIDREV